METNLDTTYDSLAEDSVSLLSEHYGEGIDGYSLWAEIPSALKAWWLGIENAPDHPAQLHYAWLHNADGTPNRLGLDDGIRFATTKAIKLLNLNYEKPVTLLDIGCGVGGSALQTDLFLQQFTQCGRQLLVVGGDDAAITGASEVLAGEEAEGGHRAQAPGPLALPGGPDGLGRVLEQGQAAGRSDARTSRRGSLPGILQSWLRVTP